jgi:hypothetical protein
MKTPGAAVDWTWTFRLAAAYQATIVPAGSVMAMGMLRGIRHRTGTAPPPRSSGRTPGPVAAVAGG